MWIRLFKCPFLFGNFKKLTLKAGNIGKKSQVWAQGLAEKKPVNITSRVTIKDGSVTMYLAAADERKPSSELVLSTIIKIPKVIQDKPPRNYAWTISISNKE